MAGLTLADRFTLARLVLAPVIVAAYLLLPVDYQIVFWVCGALCGFAELTDFLDGRVARARREVSDFGKLADPFCDVFYRLAMFMVMLLPIGGVGYTPDDSLPWAWFGPPVVVNQGAESFDVAFGVGLVPFIPVLLMVLREVVAGALRSMAATKGLVLAARMSGKIKAWVQGMTIITAFALPALLFGRDTWHLWLVAGMTWVCAILSVYSIIEYIVVNKAVLAQLIQRRPMPESEGATAAPAGDDD